ncbi:hypothetical protein AAC387_Pa07g3228 [Persea americana]
MQSTHVRNILKPPSPILQSTLVSFSTLCGPPPPGKFIPNHPILAVLSKSSHPQTDLRALHAHTVTSGLLLDPFAASRIVQLFLKSDPSLARAIFHALHHPDVYTWNAMIMAHPDAHSSVIHYFRMLQAGAPPNNYTFALLVKACVEGRTDILVAMKVHGQILKRGVEDLLVVRNSLINMYCNMGCLKEARALFDLSSRLDLISWNSMISGYGKAGDVVSARDLFEEMPERSLVSWGAMIDGYVRKGGFLEALKLFNEMMVGGMKPDVVILVSVLKGCAQLGALDQGRWIHIYVEKNRMGWERNVMLSTALIDMYAKCGCIDHALEVFNGVGEGDVVLWNAMIGGLAMHGLGQDALEMFWGMKRKGLVPNETTFVNVLCACTHAGMVERGREIFCSMKKDYGVEPQREHYGCLADLLGRAGLVREAEEVITNMPMEPQPSQWGALMAACRTHNNVKVGERVGKRLISLEPHDGGRYVLLSNVYAGASRWEDALEMRRVMEEKGAKKERGCSFIECNGVVHEFSVGDKSHPQCRGIYEKLSEMERELKKVGYAQDTSQMLVEMGDEEDKGIALSYHSEKLAIAFGIINMGQGTPIRVVKNLRVCRDCHAYTKLVSKVYKIEIVVRDRNRFHRFRDGLCSCMDYW